MSSGDNSFLKLLPPFHRFCKIIRVDPLMFIYRILSGETLISLKMSQCN